MLSKSRRKIRRLLTRLLLLSHHLDKIFDEVHSRMFVCVGKNVDDALMQVHPRIFVGNKAAAESVPFLTSLGSLSFSFSRFPIYRLLEYSFIYPTFPRFLFFASQDILS